MRGLEAAFDVTFDKFEDRAAACERTLRSIATGTGNTALSESIGDKRRPREAGSRLDDTSLAAHEQHAREVVRERERRMWAAQSYDILRRRLETYSEPLARRRTVDGELLAVNGFEHSRPCSFSLCL